MSDSIQNGTGDFRDRIRLFQQNRKGFPREQLLPFVGKWVAFSTDGTRIIARDTDLASLEISLRAQGMDPQPVLFEHILDDSNTIDVD
jgi:hypothetical protein